MIQDMKTILTRMFIVVVLIMISMAARADVKVLYGENGTELQPAKDGTITLGQKELTGGTIIISQEEQKDGTSKVTFAVTPDKNYKLAENGLEVYAVIPPGISPTRGLEVSTALTLKSEDFKDEALKRTYTTTIDSKLNLWVKSADFQQGRNDGAKVTPGVDAPLGIDYSGVYYFINCGSGKDDPTKWIDNDQKIENITNSDDYFYLVPADNPQQNNYRDAYFSSNYSTAKGDSEKPYLTTYRTKKDAAEVPTGVTNRQHNSVWIVKFVSTDDGTDYYNLIHAATGKYVVYEPPYPAKNNRKSVHLLTIDSPGENAKFAITTTNPTKTYPARSGYYNFRVKSITSGNRFLNPTNANYNFYYAIDGQADGAANYFRGLVGIYLNKNNDNKDDASASDWKPEKTLLPAPTISYISESNTFTISYDQLPEGYDILYTTDGSEPTIEGTTTSTYADSPVQLTGSSNTVKAVVARYGLVLTEMAILEPCATPIITYDYTTSNVSITCATPGSSIYYTTDGKDPTTSSTSYSQFSVSSATTVKAFATHANLPSSAIAELSITQVATPTIQNNGSNAISITTTTPDATIYYTTDGSTPTTSSAVYSSPLTDNVSNVNIKAIAVKENMITSAVGSGFVTLQCATPVITRDGMTFTLSCSMPTNANLYYKFGTGSETLYSEPVVFTSDQLPMTVTAVARHSDYTDSEEASMEMINGSGTPEDPYLIYGSTDFTNFVTNVNNGTTASKCYKLETDVSGSGVDAITTAFTGTFDGGMHIISGLGHALFNSVNGGTVKNVILDDVSISGNSNGNAGAICCEATGDTRIYNCGVLASGSTVAKDEDGYDKITLCSSSISGTNYAGSIVGLLNGSARVINCFSYANVSGGTVGGIVGYNNVATTASNLQTMVMNCMYYGEVSGTSIAPIYNGNIITNIDENKGVGNYNYFRLEASYVQPTGVTYNCALGAEDRYLQRFEFFRNLLNSHRELAGWWATGTYSSSEMMKWVLEPSQLGTSTPYPILKVPGKYPSVVNIDAENAPLALERNKGGKLGTLSVTISGTGGGAVYSAPDGASISTGSLTLNITDKDPDHFNFNYYKVQLPYYNDVGTGNYTGNRVVTGWKITSITGGTAGTFKKEDSAEGYNFADRNCTNKDLYSVSGRIFNQGAYWDVPEGVTAITIQPYWAKCVYLADQNADKVYNTDMSTGYDVPNVGGGKIYTNGNSYSIAGENQVVYTAIGNAIASDALFAGYTDEQRNNQSVYDYAVVLVGNYHHYYTENKIEASKSKPYTVTSIDLDGDNEPDYSYILRYDKRSETHPVRADFINIPGLGMAQKSTGGTGSYNFGIMIPKGWFESTNTSLFRFTQFEYEHSSRSETDAIIVQGGVIEQWVSNNQKGTSNKIPYIHVGGNVWFKEFHTGCHQDKKIATKHSPISVTGGDYDEFYLTGLYQSEITSKGDNAECYINGGRFGTVCGAAMEGIGKAKGADNTGNITWLIQNADIHEFYAGGLNAAKPVTGNLSTTIVDSHVDIFCGGPKFGDMSDNKTVVTKATGCTFGIFFGAGYGGNSYSRQAPRNHNNIVNFPHNDSEGAGNNSDWNDWLDDHYTQAYSDTYGGVSTQFSYQFLPMSNNGNNVARIFVDYVKFSLATCHNVTSSLTGCTITGNFYGGGSLGKVEGNVTSTLANCEIQGSAFGAGYSASLPTVEVDSIGFRTEPYYYTDLGTYRKGVKGSTTTYTWEGKTGNLWVDNTNHILYTDQDLTALGSVTGTATLTINGTTTVLESVYGGGEESGVGGDTEVTINSGTIGVPDKGGYRYGNVYGGGKGKIDNEGNLVVNSVADLDAGLVKGNTSVTINGTKETTKIVHNVYGGGAVGSVGTFTRDANGMPTTCTDGTGNTTVTIKGGTIGHDRKDSGMVNGSSRGWEGNPDGSFLDQLAWVNNASVVIGNATTSDEDDKGPSILGSVYGGGENGHNYNDGNVTINKGTIGNAKESANEYDCGNVYGAGCGTDTYWIDANGNESKDEGEEHHNQKAGWVRGITTITVNGGNILRNVYGGGSMGSVGNDTDAESGKATITINGGTIGSAEDSDHGHVFGGPKGSLTETEFKASVKSTLVNINAHPSDAKKNPIVWGSVFGGGEAGIVIGSVVVNMIGGTVGKDVYGGGALAHTQTSSWDVTANSNAGNWATGKTSASSTTTVSLTGGTILGEAYGGALGQKNGVNGATSDIEAYVYGDVLLELNKDVADNAKGCAVGQVFGCNNINGTPKGDVMVHVYATQNAAATQIANTTEVSNAKVKGCYEVEAVYGGGNQAAYEPAAPMSNKMEVIIDGCDRTSIKQVYGGGNAACTPATNVTVNGTFEILELFGGGNGLDNILINGVEMPNPGANVGYKNYSEYYQENGVWKVRDDADYDTKEERMAATDLVYGTGKASVNIYGGTVHRVFGGSNTKGNVRQTAVTLLDEEGECDFCVDEAYGGGKSAPMDAEAQLHMACIPGLKAAYGGAQDADIQDDVKLNITNGTFDRVFGGNNENGKIHGTITVNIEETGCKPLIIGELYGGGNLAPYEAPEGKNGPTLNVRSFTSIGDVFGGGYGENAVVKGDIYVNINVTEGKFIDYVGEEAKYDEDDYPYDANGYKGKTLSIDGHQVILPNHAKGKIGAINYVYGGGNEAKVIGNTNVNVGTTAKEKFASLTDNQETTDVDESEKAVVGADIRGNVYGGGNNAEVTGDTNVTIGKKATP